MRARRDCGNEKARGATIAIKRIIAGGLLGMVVFAVMPTAFAAKLDWQVEGIDGELADNVRAHLGEPREVETKREVRIQRGRARDRALDALRALGYYEPSIAVSLEGDIEQGWVLTLTVEPGEPVRVTNIDIAVRGDGSDDKVFRATIDALPISQGDILNHGTYEAAKSALRNRALSRGYFDYRFEVSRLAVDPEQKQATIRLILASGPRYRVERISYPDTPFRDELIERLIDVDTPVPYSSDLVARLNRRLADSGYFSNARVDVRRDEAADGVVPVNLDLTAREPNTVDFGVGFSTDEGPRVRAGWQRHWVNARGHRMGADARVSAVRQNATANYTIPLRDPIDDLLKFQTGVQAEDIEDSKSLRATVGVKRQQRFNSGWQRVQSLRLLHERFEQADDKYTTTLLLPGLSFTRVRARGQPDTSWGDSQSYSVEVAHESLLSDISLARLKLSNKWRRTLAERHRFTFRLDAGGLNTSSFEEVPSSLRFFAGGDNSVRGFAYQSLSPENDDGELIGGRYLLTGSAEYSYPFLEDWRAAAFVDAGNAFTQPDEAEAKVGVGPGIRWQSPVGTIRLDLGYGISEPEPPWRFHLSLGPAF